jgi:DNA-binding transcriptional regulator/RsmH inhibitor MraZ
LTARAAFIPAHLRALGGLTDAIYIQGAGAFFTLWSPEILRAGRPAMGQRQGRLRQPDRGGANELDLSP